MGHGIAQVSAMSGYNVILRDIEQQFLDKALEKIKWSLEKLVSKEKITKPESDEIFSRIKELSDDNFRVFTVMHKYDPSFKVKHSFKN